MNKRIPTTRQVKRHDFAFISPAVCLPFGIVFFLLGPVISPSPCQSKFELTPAVDRWIRSGMEDMYNYRLGAAEGNFQQLIATFPDHPVGYVYMAEIAWWQAIRNRGDDKFVMTFNQRTELAISKSKAMLAHSPADFYTHFYLAVAYGNRARFCVTVKRQFFSAMLSGMKANEHIKAAMALHSDNVDCLVGTGSFKYYTGALPAVLRPFAWMIGAHGDKQAGLKELEEASRNGTYCQTEAKLFLLGLYANEQRWEEYRKMLTILTSSYPGNPVLLEWLVDHYISKNMLEEGKRQYDALLDRMDINSKTETEREFIRAQRRRMER